MGKKVKRYKVGMNSETYAISLVDAPAIESDFVALAKEEEKVEVKLSEEKHLLYGAALIPDKDIYRNNGENEFYINFSKESIEKMSQDFMKEYRQYEIKTDHEDVANEVCVVESWLVTDAYKDKSNALGINVPEGTWMVGLKVNNIETWDRVKAGELKGFSVESMISLEEFSKNDNNMINVEEMSFWTKMKEVLAEVFSKNEDEVEPINEVELEEQEPAPQEPQVEPQPTEEPKVEVQNGDPAVVEPKPQEVVEEPKVEEPKPQEQPKDNHLEELVNSLKEEIAALKEMNSGLKKEIKNLGKQPSAAPVNTNAKPNAADTYSAWRETMRQMING